MMSNLEDRIKEAAEAIGGVPKLAELTEIPKRTLYSYAAGKSEPTANQVARIVRVTGVSPAWLVLGEGEKLARAQTGSAFSETAQPGGNGSQVDVIDGLQRYIAVEVRSERQLDPDLIRRIINLVDQVYAETGHKAPIGNIGYEVATLYNELASRMPDLGPDIANAEELQANLLALRLALRRRLEQAQPGSGKASASNS